MIFCLSYLDLYKNNRLDLFYRLKLNQNRFEHFQ